MQNVRYTKRTFHFRSGSVHCVYLYNTYHIGSCLTVHLLHKIMLNGNLMQQGNFIDIFLVRHVSGTYGHHREHVPETCRAKNISTKLPCCIKLAFHIISREKSFAFPGFKPQFLSCPACDLVTILTEVYWGITLCKYWGKQRKTSGLQMEVLRPSACEGGTSIVSPRHVVHLHFSSAVLLVSCFFTMCSRQRRRGQCNKSADIGLLTKYIFFFPSECRFILGYFELEF
jgi:hypothetical protein